MYQVWLKFACKSYREECLISLFNDYFPLEGTWSFIWTDKNSLYLRIHCAKFCWNWSCGFGDKHENVCLFGVFRPTQMATSPLPVKGCKFWLTTDKRRSEKFTWLFKSGELKKKYSIIGNTSTIMSIYSSGDVNSKQANETSAKTYVSIILQVLIIHTLIY